jgi:hypothetical protein
MNRIEMAKAEVVAHVKDIVQMHGVISYPDEDD